MAQIIDLQRLLHEAHLVRISNEIDSAVDRKDWERARSFFADELKVDFSSLTGVKPGVMSADNLIQGWASNLGPNKTSFHMRTNHLVAINGDRGSVHSNGYAWNRMDGNGDPLWEVWGNYVHQFVRGGQGWRVTAFTFVMTHQRGNMWVKTTPSA